MLLDHNLFINPNKILAIWLLFILLFPISKSSNAIENIVIDPGHGGEDPGCFGINGSTEKDINLEIAKKLADIIQNRLQIQTSLTRKGDYNLDLLERTGIANYNKADIFIAIHVNSTFTVEQTGQIMIFITCDSIQEIENRINERGSINSYENENDKAIVWDKVQNGIYKESFRLASILEEEARKSGIWRESIIKQAPVLVLKGANMPAVEVEIDFLSSPMGEDRLKNTWYQERICEVFYRAIVRFMYAIEEDPNALSM